MAILIPTRNRSKILEETMEGLLRAGFKGASLFVYDDASEPANAEATRALLTSWPGATLLSGTTRVGQAEGRNVLLRACNREYALFLDDDSFPDDSGWLERVVSEMPGEQRLAVTTFQYRSAADGALSELPGEPRYARSFLGGACLGHVPSLLAVGGFRSFFVYGYEEPETAMRLWLNGYRVRCNPSVIIHHNHFERPDEKRDHREYDYLYARNGILMSTLNLPLWLGLPQGLARSLRRASLHRRHLWPKVRGMLAGVTQSFTLWRQRTVCSLPRAWRWLRCPLEEQ